jgi:ABC-2 type transporter
VIFLKVPLELRILRREVFNRWFGSAAYYLALSIADAPVLIASSVIFNLISYPLTGQPMETRRIMLVIAICVSMSLVGQVLGLFASSMFDLTVNINLFYY